MSEKIGPYELDSIYPGECVRLMASLPDGCIDLTVTSPPYDNLRTYNGYTFDFESIAQQLWRVTKVGGVVVWVVGDETKNGSETGTSFRQALYFMGLGFNLHDTMIYQVPGSGAKGSNLAYWQSFEYMFVFSKGIPKSVNRIKDKKNRRQGTVCVSGKKQHATGTRLHPDRGTIVQEYGYRDNVWVMQSGNNGDDQTDHPAPFPEALARDHILSWSNPGDVVLDPMCGSGTTCKMAKESGRHWLGFDISPEYVELARRRVESGRIPLFTLQPNGAINV